MPGVDRECVTHHAACDCREAAHRAEVERLEAEVAELRSELAANAHATGVQMDQARAAEAEVARLRAALEHYANKGVWDGNYYVPCKAGPDVARAALAGESVMERVVVKAEPWPERECSMCGVHFAPYDADRQRCIECEEASP